jgi:hypothetical protein
VSFHTPKYRLHKGRGQALVQINGKQIYLGKYNSKESKEEYRRLVAEWAALRKRNGAFSDALERIAFTSSALCGIWVS